MVWRREKREEKEGTGDIEECAQESISLIRRASLMHRLKYTHIHTYMWYTHMYVRAHTRISDFLCPLIWQVSDNSCHAPLCTRKCSRCIFSVLLSRQFMFSSALCVLISIWQLNGFCFSDTHEPSVALQIKSFFTRSRCNQVYTQYWYCLLLILLLKWTPVVLYYPGGKHRNGNMLQLLNHNNKTQTFKTGA